MQNFQYVPPPIGDCWRKTFLPVNMRLYLKLLTKVGHVGHLSKRFTENDLKYFVQITGDHNPIHLSESEAIKAGFKGCVVHGALING